MKLYETKYRLFASFSNRHGGGKRKNAPKSIDYADAMSFAELLKIDPTAVERYFVSIVRDPSELVF